MTLARLRRRLPVLKSGLDAFLGLIYPNVCQLCREQPATADVGYVCSGCDKAVARIAPPFCHRCGLPHAGAMDRPFVCANCKGLDLAFDFARAAALTRGPVLEALHQFKYRQALWIEPFLVQLVLPVARNALADRDWHGIVPVPLHPVRLREREFNQAERLGRQLARLLGIPLRTDLVRRHLATPSQTRLDRAARHANMRQAFSPAAAVPPALDGTHWVVVDDVFTTGATTNAVAGVLRALGAATVAVCTVARGA